MRDQDPIIPKVSIPDPLAPDSEKETRGYILNWARAIQHEWFSKNEGQDNCKFQIQKNDFHLRRLYARGEHPTDLLNDTLNDGEEESYTNFDLRPIQVLPRFVNLMSNHATERLFKLRAEATDKYSTDQRDNYRRAMQNLMVSKPLLEDAKNLHGVDLAPDGIEEIPESMEEIEVKMKMKYKPAIEIATEKAIKYTMDMNSFEQEQYINIKDLITLGVAGLHHETDPTKGIITRSVDPADMVWSYPEFSDFRKAYYFGEVRRMTITEAMRISNMELNEEELQNLAKTHDRWATHMGYSNTRTNRDEDLEHMMVDVLFFNFKAYNTLSYKKKYKPGNRFSMIPKGRDFEKKDPTYKGYDAVKKTYDVWYKGALIMGTDILFNYGKCENMVRPEGILHKTMPNYLMYALEPYQGRFRSPVSGVMSYIDQMQQVHVKIQQMIAKARPAGVAIDISGLSEVVMGKGGEVMTPLELQRIYDQTGNVYYSSVDDDGSVNYNREPIRELPNGIIRGLPELINAYNHYLELVRSSLGVPQGVDATLPDERTLVGVQKLAAASANTATRHILEGSLRLTRNLGTALALRLKDIFKYSNLKEAYINAIGKSDVKVLESIKKYHLHDLSIIIELRPDVQEKEQLNVMLQVAIERDQISVDDAIDIGNIDNVKLAYEVLKIRREKYQKNKQQQELQRIDAGAKANGDAAERAAQSEIQKIQAQEEERRKTLQLEYQLKAQLIGTERDAKSELMEQEAEYKLIIEGTGRQIQGDIDMKKEKIKRGGTFESSEDNISGSVEMGEMGPS